MKDPASKDGNVVTEKDQPVFDIENKISSARGSVRKRDGDLISILSSAYEIYHMVETDEDEKEESIVEIDRLLSEAKASKPKKTHTKIVQLIFGESDMDRRRVSAYAAVLRNSIEADISPTDFSEWVKSAGGIDKASRINSEPRQELDVELALDQLTLLDPICVIDGKDISKHIKKTDCEFKLVVCIWDASSDELKAYRLIENQKIITSASRPLAKGIFNEVDEIHLQPAKLESPLSGADDDELKAA